MDEEENSPYSEMDGSESAAARLDHIIRKGPPEDVLSEEEADHAVTESLIEIFEEDALMLLSRMPSMTPEWSLYIRRFLEAYSEEAEVDNPLIVPGAPQENYLYGFGLLADGMVGPRDSLDEETLRQVERMVGELFLSSGDLGLRVHLHPEWAEIPDLYLFSFEERRAFLESMFPPSPGEAYPAYLSPPDPWMLSRESIPDERHPVLADFLPVNGERGEISQFPIALVGAFYSRIPPENGSVRERIERFPDDVGFQEKLQEISRTLFPGTKGVEDVSLSIVPWSYLLPMAVSLSLVQKVVTFLEHVRPKGRETLELVPFWEKGFLWLHASIRGATETGEFLLIDEYVWEFVSELVPTLLESHLPIRTKWHPLPADGRELSLGVL